MHLRTSQRNKEPRIYFFRQQKKEPEGAAEKAIWYINHLFVLEHIYCGEELEYHENGRFLCWVRSGRLCLLIVRKKDASVLLKLNLV